MVIIIVTLMAGYYAYKYINLNIDWNMAIKAMFSCLLFIPVAWIIRVNIHDTLLRLLLAIPVSALGYFIIQTLAFKNPLMKEAILYIREKGLKF
ncbi:MAG: hypothetical protein ACWGNO_10435 [Desulfobacterales bacterium]